MPPELSTFSLKPRLLVGVTGSVDIMLVPQYLLAIKANIDCFLTVLMTPHATNFLSASTLALYADRVISGERPEDWPTDKPSRIVADNDLFLVLPATAATLATAAQGGATNRLTTVILASNFPVLFFPVMGSTMWEKPAVQRNVSQLQEDGYHVFDPVWHENYDIALKKMVGHPSLPSEETLISLIRSYLKIE